MTDVRVYPIRTDDCEGLPAPARVPDPIPFPRPPHTLVHVVPQPDCTLCPETPCPCGAMACPLVAEHMAAHRCAEVTLLERCA